MLKSTAGIYRKPTTRRGANRALVGIPRGSLHKTLLSGRDAMFTKTLTGNVHSPEPYLQTGENVLPDGGCQQGRHASQQIEKKLRANDENRKMCEYLAPLFAALPCGVLIADSSNQLRMANPEACRMLFGNDAGGSAAAAELGRHKIELAGVLKSIADAQTRVFRLAKGESRQLLKISRICLSAEQGLSADRVYLLQTVDDSPGADKEKSGATP